jgi:F-type H+-transporting ATPase subunit gamma
MQMLESIRHKIESAEDLYSVVKTMKVLSAVNIHAYEKAVQSINKYFQNIETGLQIVLKKNPEMLIAPTKATGDIAGIIVFGAQKGMAGNFNLPVINRVRSWVEAKGAGSKTPHMVCSIGDRIREQLKDIGLFTEDSFDFPAFRYRIDSTIQDLLLMIENWRFQKNVSTIQLFYNKPLRGISFQPTTLQLFPLDMEWLKRLAKREWFSRSIPLYTMPTAELFNHLVRQYFFIILFRAFIESMASENASRLMAMQKAEQNIEERLDNLNARFNQQRQKVVTDELLDIIAGFEALTK